MPRLCNCDEDGWCAYQHLLPREKKNLIDDWEKITTVVDQNKFIRGCLLVKPVNKKQHLNKTKKQREFTVVYHLTPKQALWQKYQVCKGGFHQLFCDLETGGISERWVKTITKQMWTGELDFIENRGKHDNCDDNG
jgi:hypothetical protein